MLLSGLTPKGLLLQTDSDYISTGPALDALVEQAGAASVLAVDTEFIREKTFWPQLCLIQLAFGSKTAIVDPLALKNLAPLAKLFTDPGIVKVFHSAEQDLEVLYHQLKVIPSPLFDTQLAAELLGQSQHASLAALVREYCGVRLSKSDSFTDWKARPLTASQKRYALDDVRYLPQIYADMHSRLSKLERLAWL